MAVYVDAANVPYRGMLMSHLWADDRNELLAMARVIGLDARWLQAPPRASWVHFDVCRDKRAMALKAGAVAATTRDAVEHRRRIRTAAD